jgi:hypothetical protein
MTLSTSITSIPIIDDSTSMSYYGYEAITVIDTKAFISNFLPGDYIGVASFERDSSVTYPLTLVDTNLTVPAAAAAAVEKLTFNGGSTNMGAGIQTAVDMLASAPANINQGLVLLTDGYQNHGTKPLPLPTGTPPIYACAMGPHSDQKLLTDIANQSGGKYYYAPYVYHMMEIYNQIRSQTPNTQLLVNQYKNAGPNDFLLIPATISAGNDLGQFSVVWSDAATQFVSGQIKANQISVTLVSPAGVVLTPSPSLQGGGYVVFNIPNPAVGLWYIQIMYAGSAPQGLTGGAFEYSPSGNAAPINMRVDAPNSVKAGEKIPVVLNLEDDGQAISGQQVHVALTRPQMGIREALQTYSSLLKDIVLPDQIVDECAENIDIARLRELYHQQLPTKDLLPHIKQSSFMAQSKSGNYQSKIIDTLTPGSYNLHLNVTGYSKKSATPFSRSHMLSILVEE